MKKQRGYTVIELFYVMFIFMLLITWPYNLYRFTQLDFEPSYKAEIIRGVGVFTVVLAPFIAFQDFEEEE